ncbi:MAG: hypothetical protein IID44_03045 [Planctomycetes bacterium]|nr:hypothetical protein [Planctomycetota bacterium]
MSVEVSPDIEAMWKTLVETGRYGDENQVLGEALRLLQRRDGLDQKIQEGADDLDRGKGIDADVVFDRMKKKAAEKVNGKQTEAEAINSDAGMLLKEFIETGRYRDENEVLSEAISLFKRRDEIHAHVQIGIDQLERGEVVSGEEVFRELKDKAARLLDGDA